MAVPFFVPDDAEAAASQGSASQATSPTTTSPVLIPQSGTSSSSQSPLQSPVNGEHLVQAFCEALYRYSRGGSPGFPMTPQSPSCSSANNGFNSPGYHGDIFFPRSSNFNSPRTQREEMTPQRPVRRQSFSMARRSRLTSTGEETEDEDIQDDCQFDMEPNWYDLDDHYRNLAQREHLQEFSGRIPTQRQKKKETDAKSKAKEQQTFAWPTVVTAVVLAVGCGFLAAR